MLIGLYNQAKQGNVQAVREVNNIAGKGIAFEELKIKQKELKLKEQALKQNLPQESEEGVTIIDDIPKTD